MRKSIATIAAMSALTLALAGCSSEEAEPEPEQAEQPTQAGETEPATAEADVDLSGDWAFDHFGGTATFTMPPTEEPASEWAQDVIDYRTDAGLDTDLHWVDLTIDNMNGTENVSINDVTIVTTDGDQISSEPWLNDLISEAQDVDNTEQYNEGVDISNSEPDSVKPGAKGEAVVAFAEPVDNIARVWITTPSSSELEAYPMSGDAQEPASDPQVGAAPERTDGLDAAFILGAYAIDESTGYLDAYHGDLEAEETLIETGLAMCNAADEEPGIDEAIQAAAEVGRDAGFTDEESSIIYGAAVTTYCPIE